MCDHYVAYGKQCPLDYRFQVITRVTLITLNEGPVYYRTTIAGTRSRDYLRSFVWEPNPGRNEIAVMLGLNAVEPGLLNQNVALSENALGKGLRVARLLCALENQGKKIILGIPSDKNSVAA